MKFSCFKNVEMCLLDIYSDISEAL